jgi:hypothetical protein
MFQITGYEEADLFQHVSLKTKLIKRLLCVFVNHIAGMSSKTNFLSNVPEVSKTINLQLFMKDLLILDETMLDISH